MKLGDLTLNVNQIHTNFTLLISMAGTTFLGMFPIEIPPFLFYGLLYDSSFKVNTIFIGFVIAAVKYILDFFYLVHR